jgi:hypothetical protein
VAMAGQTRGAIGLSLIFCFFCIKAKEKAKTITPPIKVNMPKDKIFYNAKISSISQSLYASPL